MFVPKREKKQDSLIFRGDAQIFRCSFGSRNGILCIGQHNLRMGIVISFVPPFLQFDECTRAKSQLGAKHFDAKFRRQRSPGLFASRSHFTVLK